MADYSVSADEVEMAWLEVKFVDCLPIFGRTGVCFDDRIGRIGMGDVTFSMATFVDEVIRKMGVWVGIVQFGMGDVT